MKDLNKLRARDLAAEDEDLEDAKTDLDPDREVEEALEEAKALDDVLKELDAYYGTSEYTRLGCLSHKVGYIYSIFFVSN